MFFPSNSDWNELNVYIFLAFNRETGIPAIDTVLPAGTLELWLPAQNSLMEVYWSNLDRHYAPDSNRGYHSRQVHHLNQFFLIPSQLIMTPILKLSS